MHRVSRAGRARHRASDRHRRLGRAKRRGSIRRRLRGPARRRARRPAGTQRVEGIRPKRRAAAQAVRGRRAPGRRLSLVRPARRRYRRAAFDHRALVSRCGRRGLELRTRAAVRVRSGRLRRAASPSMPDRARAVRSRRVRGARVSTAPHDPLARGRLLWLAAVVVGASLPHWLALPAWILLLLVGCVLWRFVAERRGYPMPGKRLRVLLTLLALVAVLASFRT